MYDEFLLEDPNDIEFLSNLSCANCRLSNGRHGEELNLREVLQPSPMFPKYPSPLTLQDSSPFTPTPTLNTANGSILTASGNSLEYDMRFHIQKSPETLHNRLGKTSEKRKFDEMKHPRNADVDAIEKYWTTLERYNGDEKHAKRTTFSPGSKIENEWSSCFTIPVQKGPEHDHLEISLPEWLKPHKLRAVGSTIPHKQASEYFNGNFGFMDNIPRMYSYDESDLSHLNMQHCLHSNGAVQSYQNTKNSVESHSFPIPRDPKSSFSPNRPMEQRGNDQRFGNLNFSGEYEFSKTKKHNYNKVGWGSGAAVVRCDVSNTDRFKTLYMRNPRKRGVKNLQCFPYCSNPNSLFGIHQESPSSQSDSTYSSISSPGITGLEPKVKKARYASSPNRHHVSGRSCTAPIEVSCQIKLESDLISTMSRESERWIALAFFQKQPEFDSYRVPNITATDGIIPGVCPVSEAFEIGQNTRKEDILKHLHSRKNLLGTIYTSSLSVMEAHQQPSQNSQLNLRFTFKPSTWQYNWVEAHHGPRKDTCTKEVLKSKHSVRVGVFQVVPRFATGFRRDDELLCHAIVDTPSFKLQSTRGRKRK